MLGDKTFKAGLLAAVFIGLVGCSDADIGATEDNTFELGSLSRLFGKLKNKMEQLGAAEFYVAADDQAPAAPPFEPIVAGRDLDFDGAIIGRMPGDFYGDQHGCVTITDPNEVPSPADLEQAADLGFGHESLFGDEAKSYRDDVGMTVYVNGIRTSVEAHCETLRWIASDVLGDPGPIVGVYNATEGFAGDIWEVTWDRFSIPIENTLAKFGLGQLASGHDNRAVTTLANVIIHSARIGRPLNIWAHSQGGAITSLALRRAQRVLVAEGTWTQDGDVATTSAMLRVASFGAAAPSWPRIETDYGEEYGGEGTIYRHHVHLRDATPAVFGLNGSNWELDGSERAGGGRVEVYDGVQEACPEKFQWTEGVHLFGTWETYGSPEEAPEIDFLDLHPTDNHSVYHYLMHWSVQGAPDGYGAEFGCDTP